jgi:hypothetical protein
MSNLTVGVAESLGLFITIGGLSISSQWFIARILAVHITNQAPTVPKWLILVASSVKGVHV